MSRCLFASPLLASALLFSAAANSEAPLPAAERLKSCDEQVSLAAAKEILNDPKTLGEPLNMFGPALVLFHSGERDEAVFWLYAAQLRTKYQLAFEGGDRGQLLSFMQMTVAPPINSYAFQDVDKLVKTLERVLDWDKATPNPFRVRPRTEAIDSQLEKIYAGMNSMKVNFAAKKEVLEAQARKAAPRTEQMYSTRYNPRCRPGQVDPSNVARESAKEEALVTQYVRKNSEVIRDAGEIRRTWVEYGRTKSTDTMPHRYEVGVISATGKESHAIVDVARENGAVKFSLVCIARERWVSRDVRKDPCSQ